MTRLIYGVRKLHERVYISNVYEDETLFDVLYTMNRNKAIAYKDFRSITRLHERLKEKGIDTEIIVLREVDVDDKTTT